MPTEWKLDFNVLVGALALLSTCIFFYLQNQKEQRSLKREIYQRLELAANDVFRFEADHLPIIAGLYDAKQFPGRDAPEYRGLIAYVTQILGLFEIAVRFRKEEIMPPDVFGSWVIWFYDLCEADNFSLVWADLRFNYLPELREILDEGIAIVNRHPEPEKARQLFFDFMASRFEDKMIQSWLTHG